MERFVVDNVQVYTNMYTLYSQRNLKNKTDDTDVCQIKQGQIEVEMPLQVLNPDPKKRFLAANDPISQSNDYVHLMMKKR